MKLSEVWLREWVQPGIETAALAEQLTMAGLEVDGIEPASEPLPGVVVGEIVGCEQHPDADKLRICQVAHGAASHAQVVCGAANARVGIKVPFATVGAQLPDNFKIKKAKLRGVESFGMLCAQQELGLGEANDGLWELSPDAPVGAALADYLALADTIIEIDLTPNRGDCLSVRGLAREIAALNNSALTAPSWQPVEVTEQRTPAIELQAAHGCARYCGRLITGLDLQQPTPVWMQERLRRAGVRSLGPAVDVTNYVLLELGQPMHAFDAKQLNGPLTVRFGRDESLTLLDDSEVVVDSETLVIADDHGPLAIAGVMGGAASAVTAATTDVVLESAWFNPLVIAGKARRYGKHTDSSHRFERGVDPQLQREALERATALLVGIAGGQAGPVVECSEPAHLPQPAEITLRSARLSQQLGIALPSEQVESMLQRLGLEKLAADDSSSQWRAPSWRFDLAIEQDLIEEVARIYGYNNLPTSAPQVALNIAANHEGARSLSEIRAPLLARGYNEAITYSFVDPTLQQLVAPHLDSIAVQNPISAEMAVMRNNLWVGLLGAASYNLKRQQPRVRLFESGLQFSKDATQSDGRRQRQAIAGLICGARLPESWNGGRDRVDFYDLKADVEALLAPLRWEVTYRPIDAAEQPALHPGQAARVELNGQAIGYLGALHPSLYKPLALNQTVYLFELDYCALSQRPVAQFQPLSNQPAVRRDLAFIVASATAAGDLLATAKQAAGPQLVDITLFDLYQPKQGTGDAPASKSIAIGLTFQERERTLSDAEIDTATAAVIAAVAAEHGGELRS